MPLEKPSLSSSTLATVNEANETRPIGATSRFISLLIAHIGAALALFLATTDATIVSTSLPTIASELNASPTQYSWVGVAYMLTQTACQPVYPVFSRLFGRKAVLFFSISVFVLGSTFCGLAQNALWLILARSFQGMGAGGIVNSIWVLTSEIVTPSEKHKWSQALSLTWSASAIAGPILGGVFSEQSQILSWRWAFYMNIPVGFVAFILLYCSLRFFKLPEVPPFSLAMLKNTFLHEFDFIGVLLLVVGTSSTVLGLSLAGQLSWSAPVAIALLSTGLLLLVVGVLYEFYTTRVAILPKVLFSSRTEVIILIITFFHNVAFNAGTFYLALFFQAVLGIGPLLCGVLMLPYSLGSALASIPVALFNDYYSKKTKDTRCYKIVVIVGLGLSTLGFGLLTMLSNKSPLILKEIYPLIAGIGIGMLFHAPFAAITNGMTNEDRACTTSAFFLVRFIGATSGLSVAGAIFDSRLSQTLPKNSPVREANLSDDLRKLVHLRPITLRLEVLHDVSSALSWIWITCVCCLGLAFLLSLAIRIRPIDTEDTKNEMAGHSINASAEVQSTV